MRILNKKIITSLAVLLVCSCSGGKKDESERDRPETSSEDEAKVEESSSKISRESKFVTSSLSNNPLTLHVINRVKAEEMIAKLQTSLQGEGARDKRALEALIAAQWLAGQPPEELIATARRLVDLEMKQNVDRDISYEVKLNIGLAALKAKKFSMAEFFFERVRDSKNPKHKAAATTGIGIIAMIEGRVPEAVAYWNQALKESPDFEPAKFNVGFTTLKYGDYKTAGRMLSSIPGDLYADVGMISVNHLSQNSDGAEKLCDKVLKEKPNHKPALYNCALVAYQMKQDRPKAKALLTKMVKIQSNDSRYDEEAYKLVSAIDNDELEERQKLKNKDEAKPKGQEAPVREQDASKASE